MALSRVYTSTTAADITKLSLLHKLWVTSSHEEYGGARAPNPNPDPNVMQSVLTTKSDGFFRGPCVNFSTKFRGNQLSTMLHNPANKKKQKQTNADENTTSLVEVTSAR